MRVALIDPSLFTLPYDAALAGGLEACGDEVTLYGRAPGADDNKDARVRLDPSFYRLAGSRAGRALPRPARLAVKGGDHVLSMGGLGRRLARARPDVIHFQWLPMPAIDGLFLSSLGRIAPLVMTVHDTNPFNGNPASRLQSLGFAGSLRRFSRLIVHTQQGKTRLAALGLDADRIAVLPHGLLGGASAHPGTWAETGGTTTFLMFGKLKPYKGADLLIEAFARLPRALRDRARLRIIGKPYMDTAPLHSAIATAGIGDRVTIEERFIGDEEIPALFAPGTIALFPYREIEASGVLSVAIAHGCPIVATRIGGFAEAVQDGKHGLLVPPGDAGALSEALARMLTEPGFAASVARNVAALSAEVPDWTEIARRTREIYAAAGIIPVRASPTEAPARPAAASRP